ncbi:MAG: hypothetical protein K2H96_03480 [Muribaculaceae bacterium]|nr:hypothetical protein [Muribaculaceae bacterium]
MRKLLLFFLLMPIFVQAQQFYEPSDIDAMWRVWDSQATLDWLIQNGQRVNVSVNPAPRYSKSTMVVPTEICLSFLKDNRFLCLTFSQSEGIRMFTENDVYSLSSSFYAIANLMQQSWFNIDFEHIVYSEPLGWLLIPCGYYEYTGYNAIAINFVDLSQVNDFSYQSNTGNTEYYNLQGLKVDPQKNYGEILIKTNGIKSEKIFNKW